MRTQLPRYRPLAPRWGGSSEIGAPLRRPGEQTRRSAQARRRFSAGYRAMRVATVLAALACAAAEGAAYADSAPLKNPQAALLGEVRFDQRLHEPLPLEIVLRDEAGAARPLGTWFGERPVLLALVYYRCPMLCTQVLNGIVTALNGIDLIPGRDFEVVLVSIDPAETPELAREKKKSYLGRYARPGTEAGWHFLTGDQPAIESVASAAGFAYRYDPKSKQFAHASGIMVATPQGKLARYFYGIDYPTRDLRLALVEASQGHIGTAVDQVLLFCFHYDPATGRYGLAIFRLIRAAGVLTVAVLGAFIAWSLRKERRKTTTSETWTPNSD